jgi:hypothetical protein
VNSVIAPTFLNQVSNRRALSQQGRTRSRPAGIQPGPADLRRMLARYARHRHALTRGPPRLESCRVPPDQTHESQTLLALLNAQRAHVTGILEGLSAEDLGRPVLPSGWRCLGLVRHLALDVERFWFRAVVAGQSVHLEHGDAAWQVDPTLPADAVLDLYRQEAALADEIISSTPLEALPLWWPQGLFADLPRRRSTYPAPRAEPRSRCGPPGPPPTAGNGNAGPQASSSARPTNTGGGASPATSTR